MAGKLDALINGKTLTATELAARVQRHLPRGSRTSPSTITRLLRRPGRKGRRTASLTLALAIEKATDGQVRAEDLPLTNESKRLLRQLRASAIQLAPETTEPTPAGNAAA